MRITDRHEAAFRAQARQDWETFDNITNELRDDQDVLGYAALTSAVLTELVMRRFPDRRVYDVIRWCANLRKRHSIPPTEIDPTIFEAIIKNALAGIDDTKNLDFMQLAQATPLILAALLDDTEVVNDEKSFEDLINTARAAARPPRKLPAGMPDDMRQQIAPFLGDSDVSEG